MAIQVDKISDTSDGFTVEFTVINRYKRTFPVRAPGENQMNYARACVQSIVTNPVEKPDGVVIVAPAVVADFNEHATVVDLGTSIPVEVPPPIEIPIT